MKQKERKSVLQTLKPFKALIYGAGYQIYRMLICKLYSKCLETSQRLSLEIHKNVNPSCLSPNSYRLSNFVHVSLCRYISGIDIKSCGWKGIDTPYIFCVSVYVCVYG